MFDIGAAELLVIAVVAILVIGPKDMPLALRTAGRWIGQIRRVSGHFRAGIDAMVREAEMEEMEKKWQERNAQIMRAHPGDEMTPLPPAPPEEQAAGTGDHDPDADDPPPGASTPHAASAESRMTGDAGETESTAEPQLPLDKDSGNPPSKGEGA
ncbi:MAG: twin-arginine translocase subunit TatB [Citromicrobium sp.]|nr:twin-arginine translocase subunit TatB [Citromicrobium sp.]